ncbi:hypothetical protein GCM10009411_32370 [Shewanella litoralis]|uniref:Fibronectin type-III domain-containing protein n=2 Tax=Shewanella litoralis TaxID=2282700 RepID=A0ABQ2RJJ5_9GAMM|nr:hypothetical protein GCM10009411_32370 [Shewanella litoralis]
MKIPQSRLLVQSTILASAMFSASLWAISDNNAMVINTIRAIPATVCTAQSKISSCMKMNGSVEVAAGTGVPSTYSIDELAYLRDSTTVNGITPSTFTGNGIPSAGTAQNSGSLMCYVLDVDAGAAGVYNFSCEMNALTCNKLYRYHFAGSHTTAGNAEHSNTNSTNTSLYAYSTACAPVSGTNGSLNQTSADVSLNVNKGALPQTMSLEWGTTTAYGNAGVITNNAVVDAANSGTANVTASMTGLSCETSYHYRFNSTTDDSAVNGSVMVNGSDQVFTTASCDTTPPVLSDILQLTGGITDFSYTFTSNEAGNLYYVVLPSGSTAPDATQVQAGQDSTNTPVTAAGQKTLSAASAITVATSGLTAETLYSMYVVAKDAEGNITGVTSYPIIFTPSAPTTVVATSGTSQANVTFAAPSFNGGGSITSYTVTSNPGGLTATDSASPITISGLTNGLPYTFTVTATNIMGTSAASTVSNSVISKATQSITFDNPGAQDFGTSITLSATSTSGLPPSFTSSTTAVCTVTNMGVLTLVTPGTCTINANQSGDSSFNSAPQVSQSFNITALVATAPTSVQATAGDAQATVSFTAPSFNGGSAVTSYTVTSTPGSLTASGVASPVMMTGLTNGVAYTFSVTATNSAGISAASAPSNLVTPNRAPVAPNTNVTLEEDSSISIQFSAQDDVGDVLTYEVVTPPASGSLEKNGLVWLYTPNANFNGADSVTFTANDGSLSSALGTVTITVTPVNDAPQAVDDNYSLIKTETNSYSLPVLENDLDVDEDTLTIEGAAADVGIATFDNGVLTYKASTDYVGPVNLRYSISDGQKARSSAKVSLLITGENADDLPIITVPDDLDVQATGLFTKVKLGVATAVDKLGNKLPVSLVNSQQLFSPGNHLAYWQATDAQGRTALKSQKIRIHPLVSITREQVVAEGSEVKVSVYLNGEAPEYPISIPFTISGTVDANDHSLVDDQIEIVSGLSASFIVDVYDDSEVEGNEELIINLDTSLNLSAHSETRLIISEDNIAPKANIEVRQANELRTQISKLAGKVYILGKASDANSKDNLSQVWSSGELVLETDANGTFFTPDALDVGVYPISLTVSDDGSPSLSTIVSVNVKVTESLAVLTGEDSDGDLIPDDQEGFTDTDGDGIPDYLDAISQCNVLQELGLEQVLFLAESPSGICLSLGNTALADSSSGIGLSNDAIPADEDAANIGGVFDFIATNLPKQGDSYSFSLPQALPVPTNAVYRKYNVQTGWRDFVVDDKNSIASSIGEPGLCPPPGSSLWQIGLNEGYWCVQLTIQDGGANDDDGLVNGMIVDPGGVAVVLNGNNLPVAIADTFIVPVNQSRDIDVLANDTDQDNDTLMVTQVISQFGTAVVLGNQQVSYTAAPDFIGDDVLVYSISDSKGGTATSELTVSVVANRAPIAMNDMASTDDRTSILVDVLVNDSDPDDQVLALTSVTAQEGSVVIDGTQIRYTPKTGFEGSDLVSYQVSDGLGGEAVGNLTVNVKAYQVQTIDNKSGGGSLTFGWIGLLLLALLRRIKSHVKLILLSLLGFMTLAQAQAAESTLWYLDVSLGLSKTDQAKEDLQKDVNSGTINHFDNSDTLVGINIGYQISPMIAFELGYLDQGSGKTQITGSTLNPTEYHEQLKSVSPILVHGYTLGAKFTLIEHKNWRFDIPVGLLFWESEVNSRSQGQNLKTKLDDTDLYAGMHLGYQITPVWEVGVGFKYISLDPNDILSYQLNLSYHF